MKKIDTRQLSLFETREERAAIIEFDGGLRRQTADRLSQISYDYLDPMPYLLDLINDKEPLIHLFGQNSVICLIRTFSSYEDETAIQRAWVSRKDAVMALKNGGYVCYRTLTMDHKKYDVWHLENEKKGCLNAK